MDVRRVLTVRRMIVAAAAVIGVWLLVTAARVGFLGDDFGYLRAIRQAHDVNDFWTFIRQPFGTAGAWRPFVQLWWTAESQLFGSAAWAYHTVRVILYAGTAAFLWDAVRRVAGARTAVVTALAFAILPFHAEPVFWLSGLTDLLGLLGSLGAVAVGLRFLDNGRQRMLWLAVGLAAIGLLSKEFAIVTPVIMAGFDLAAHGWRGTPWRRRLFLYVTLALITIGYLWCRMVVLGSVTGGVSMSNAFSLTPYRAMVSRMSVLVNLQELTSIAPSIAAIWITWRAKIILGIGIVFFLLNVRSFRNRRFWTLTGLAALTATAYSAPQSTVLPYASMTSLQHSRFLLAPSVGAALIFAALVTSATMPRLRWWRMALAAIVILTLAGAFVINARPWVAAGQTREQILNSLANDGAEIVVSPTPLTLYVERLPADIHGAYVFHDYHSFSEAFWRRFTNPNVSPELVTKRPVTHDVCWPLATATAYMVWDGQSQFIRRDDVLADWRTAPSGRHVEFSSFADFMAGGWRADQAVTREVNGAVQLIPTGDRSSVTVMLPATVAPHDLQRLSVDIDPPTRYILSWSAGGQKMSVTMPAETRVTSLCAQPLWFSSPTISQVTLTFLNDQPLILRSVDFGPSR